MYKKELIENLREIKQVKEKIEALSERKDSLENASLKKKEESLFIEKKRKPIDDKIRNVIERPGAYEMQRSKIKDEIKAEKERNDQSRKEKQSSMDWIRKKALDDERHILDENEKTIKASLAACEANNSFRITAALIIIMVIAVLSIAIVAQFAVQKTIWRSLISVVIVISIALLFFKNRLCKRLFAKSYNKKTSEAEEKRREAMALVQNQRMECQRECQKIEGAIKKQNEESSAKISKLQNDLSKLEKEEKRIKSEELDQLRKELDLAIEKGKQEYSEYLKAWKLKNAEFEVTTRETLNKTNHELKDAEQEFERLKELDLLHAKYYDNIDEIIDILNCGRADNLKEALNVLESDKAEQQRTSALLEVEERRLEAIYEANAEMERHNRRMEEAERQAASEAIRREKERDRYARMEARRVYEENERHNREVERLRKETQDREKQREKQREEERRHEQMRGTIGKCATCPVHSCTHRGYITPSCP